MTESKSRKVQSPLVSLEQNETATGSKQYRNIKIIASKVQKIKGSDNNLLVAHEFSNINKNSKKLKENFSGLSSFTPIQMLGKGSFGEVYLVKREEKLLALKVISKQVTKEQSLVKYIHTEKIVQSKLDHPFIVKLHCTFQTRDYLFMVMDYCPGGDLGQVLQRESRLLVDRARVYLAEVLLALEELHRQEIIYRDLKPDNVVLDADGHALLIDFGLSKEQVKENEYTKSFCGSLAYLAPEMVRKSGHGRSVDWYLLGVLLYEMLVGVPPYFHKDKDKLLSNIEGGPLVVPSCVPPDALDLIAALLDRDPNERLGAGPGDSEEIKSHPFFASIDWDKALRRELQPPRPYTTPIKKENINFDKLRDAECDADNKVDRWTFISNNFY
eukprot:TRINITY_DN1398_c0_g1_i9.p1 TRINITY_DN1398_c0_g1~~TRINITY_DN1398_c0_g1_i9.p1  ORF type:complete len:385 (+),score=52.67 TRINITY_DN1398_c0_g1_i9:1148-2302(+)